jgi:hypothetical protein
MLCAALSGGVAAAAEALTIDGKGRVGIGVTAPNEDLEVARPDGGRGRLNVSDGGGASRKTVLIEAPGDTGASDGAHAYGRILAHDYARGTGSEGGMPLVLQDNGGRVGIGTRTPEHTLDVDGGARIGGALAAEGGITAPFVTLGQEPSALGAQTRTTYFRSRRNFRWYVNGTHGRSGPGAGGAELMTLDGEARRLDVRTSMQVHEDLQAESLTVGRLQVDGELHLPHGWRLRVEAHGNDQGPFLVFSRNGTNQFLTRSDGDNALMGRYDAFGGTSWVAFTSDERLKAQTTALDDPLGKVRALEGRSFAWTDDAIARQTAALDTSAAEARAAGHPEMAAMLEAEIEERRTRLARREVGLMAQDVERVLPEAVSQDADGYRSVAYHMLIPLLVEAVKAQDAVVSAQAAEIARVQAAQADQAAALDRLAAQVAGLADAVAQAAPGPDAAGVR